MSYPVTIAMKTRGGRGRTLLVLSRVPCVGEEIDGWGVVVDVHHIGFEPEDAEDGSRPSYHTVDAVVWMRSD